jgi:tetratricopeptide (TPR) repeat protein
MNTTIALALAWIAVQAIPSPPSRPAPSSDRIASTSGYIDSAGAEDGGWFQFMFSPQRFRLPRDEGAAQPMIRVINAAMERGVALTVRYDSWAGRIDAAGGFIAYPLCGLSVATGASVGDEHANCPPTVAPGVGTEAALARGLAIIETRPEQARQLLGEAAGDARLPTNLRAAALRGRGDAAEVLSETLPFAGDAYDRIVAAGLSDDRRWVSLATDDPEAQFATARMLGNLGGYAEAEDIYRAIGRRWPERMFDVTVRIGALYRRQGRYAEALRMLEDYATREGPQDGMKFHYHRAWTLTLLDRPAEAVADLTQGLISQPDYSSAYFMRACAYGRLGRIDEALADQERGLTLSEGYEWQVPSMREQLAIVRATRDALQQMVRAHSHAATTVACDRLWEREIHPRARSPMLATR